MVFDNRDGWPQREAPHSVAKSIRFTPPNADRQPATQIHRNLLHQMLTGAWGAQVHRHLPPCNTVRAPTDKSVWGINLLWRMPAVESAIDAIRMNARSWSWNSCLRDLERHLHRHKPETCQTHDAMSANIRYPRLRGLRLTQRLRGLRLLAGTGIRTRSHRTSRHAWETLLVSGITEP